MATRTWAGRALPVVQIATVTVTGYDVATTYIITVNGKSVSCIAAGSVNATATALAAAWAAAAALFTTSEFTENNATATGASGVVNFTGSTAGLPFTIVSSVSGGSGTIGAFSVTTAATGPNDWANASNWVEGVVPATGDDVTIAQGGSILYGLAQSGVTLNSITIIPSFNQQFTIGLPVNTNPASPASGYPQYRPQRLKIGCTSADINSTSPRIRLDFTPATSAVIIRNTGQPVTATEDALDLYIDDAGGSSTVQILKGTVGIDNQPGDTSTLSGLNVSFTTSQASDVVLNTGPALAVATMDQSGGSVVMKKGPTTIVKSGGTISVTAGAMTTVTNRGGIFYHDGTGTITTLNQLAQFFRRGFQAATITNCNIYAGSQGSDANGTITWTTPPLWSQCRQPAAPNDNGNDVAWFNFGTNRKTAISSEV